MHLYKNAIEHSGFEGVSSCRGIAGVKHVGFVNDQDLAQGRREDGPRVGFQPADSITYEVCPCFDDH